ncbi:arylsulfatase [Thalassoroseus pseudoceratinae]|uniref:arylsulfatase n=1 Tax=Thalassoroseus pseudoceratinae TaxID=2713176 RepID=UPI0014206D7E|nr:arylsulfatase [Thalassoroseus pseudoceratinae]
MASLLCHREIVAAKRPNVLLILTDDQGYGDLSIHGNPYLKTPAIDQLGRDGVRFERFYVNSFCAPTRGALLTGRYPLRCGVWGVTHNKETMRLSEVTIAEALQSNGYRTGCFGKWHNGEQFPYTPNGQGFDEFFGFCNGHTNAYFDAELTHQSKDVKTKGYITDVLTTQAIRFIEQTDDQPFFCYLSYNAPHSPYQIPDEYYEKFRQKGFDEKTSAFYGMCENIDDNVGRLLEVLNANRIADDTIVLFLTDNGGTAGVKHYNAGMRGGKTSVHEGGCRVPLFVRWPKRLPASSVVSRLASHIDIYPTLLELCDVNPPDGPKIDGVSLVPLLKNADADWNERVLFTHNPISESNRYPGAVRTPQYRLVRTIPGPQGGSSAKPKDRNASAWKLFDMQQDPGEKHNIASQHPQVVRELSEQYEAWIDDTSRTPLERFAIPVGFPQENPVTLNAPQAYHDGPMKFDHGPGFAHDWLTNWTDEDAKVWFDIDVQHAGTYEVEILYGCPKSEAGSTVQVQIGDASLTGPLPAAEAPVQPLPNRDERSRQRYVNRDWGRFRIGHLAVPAGRQRLELTAQKIAGERFMDFKGVMLKRLDSSN